MKYFSYHGAYTNTFTTTNYNPDIRDITFPKIREFSCTFGQENLGLREGPIWKQNPDQYMRFGVDN